VRADISFLIMDDSFSTSHHGRQLLHLQTGRQVRADNSFLIMDDSFSTSKQGGR
jgi:hypothetical protein